MDWLCFVASLLLSLAFIFHAASQDDIVDVVLGSAALLMLAAAVILGSKYKEKPHDQRRDTQQTAPPQE